MKPEILILFPLLLLSSACSTSNSTPPETKKVLVFAPTKDSIDGSFEGSISSERPEELIPGKVPRRVVYKAKATSEMIGAKEAFLNALSGKGRIFGDAVIIYSGAWRHLRDVKYKKVNSIPMRGGGPGLPPSEGLLFRDSSEAHLFEAKLYSLIGDAPDVRALSTEEMANWWPFISFDIEEPVFSVHSKDGRYVFIVSFSDKRIISIDELNALPKLKSNQ